MKNPEVIMLIGNIGSGKTTYIKNQKYVEQGYVIISRDSLRYALGGGQYIWNKKCEMIIHNAISTLLDGCLHLGLNVVIDETNINIKTRDNTLDAVMNCINADKYKTIAIVMPEFSMDESVNRRLQSNHGNFDRKLWEGVWDRFYRKYQEPISDEGFYEIKYLTKQDVMV